MTGNTTLLIVGVFAVLIIMMYLLIRANSSRRWSTCLLCMSLLSIICTISMGVNYLAAYTGRQDGIGITGRLARLIIGEGRWSLDMFHGYFEGFTALSIALVVLYFVAVLLESSKPKRY